MNKFMMVSLSIAVLGLSQKIGHADSLSPLTEGQYVTVKDGHLSYNGRRLRLWGTNFVCTVKRQGKDLELNFDRMRDVGFNGIRLNIFNCTFLSGKPEENAKMLVPATVKGSNSPMDLLDYSVYLAKQRGMFFWFSFTTSLGPENYPALPDDGTKDPWQKMMADGGTYAMYYDERAEKTFQQYAKNILEHVNPYTGKRYADEETLGLYEIINENDFVDRIVAVGAKGLAGKKLQARWNEWLTQQYKTPADLIKSWGKLNEGELLEKKTILFAPITEGSETYGAGVQREFIMKNDKNIKRYPAKRAEDIVRFACDLYAGHSRRFIHFVRSLGKPGKGISVVPITYTGRFGLNIPMYYAGSGGDFTSMGIYSVAMRPWSVKKEDPYYPFVCRLNEKPAFEQPVDLFRTKGKPYLFYECNDMRPNPFCTEFPARILAYSLWQDADGVFWFNWDDSGWVPNLKTDDDYVNRLLPIPNPSYPNAGFIQVIDEAMLAAIKVAGTIFKNGAIPPAAKPVEITLGKDLILDITGKAIGGHETQTPVEKILSNAAWQQGSRVIYDPNGPSKLPDIKDPGESIRMDSYMTLSWKDKLGYFRIDAPSAKLYTGFLKPALTFTNVSIRGIDRQFGSIALVAEDGLPLEESSSILVVATSRSQNTGMEMTPKNLTTTDLYQQGIAQVCGVPGTLPVVVDRISAVITAPWLSGMNYQKFSFTRKCFAQGKIAGNRFTLFGSEPTFYARLTRPQSKVIRKIVITGNSLTWHPPLANSDWNNNWGMAATSQEKDYAHQIYNLIARTQKEKPELVIENFQDRRIIDPAKHDKLASFKADLYIIEIGDNLKDDESNEKTLGLPYEQMLKTIKKTNPNALIFCTSTWGCSKNKDPLIRAACERQKVPYVRIDIFIGDVKNRALGEGHFKHGGVNWHPGDRGMQKIADALWQTIQPVLLSVPEGK
jgi:hypothetical protein